jgi:hypothetical protein
MILLTDPKLLFLKPQKVAGTSFEIALSKFADENAILTPILEEDEKIRLNLGFRGPQNFMLSNFERFTMLFKRTPKDKRYPRRLKFFEHISAKLVRQRLRPDIWSESYKVSIIRNPYDFIVSRYFYQEGGKKKIVYSPDDFENFCFKNKKFNRNINKYFIGKEQIIDLYLRYETINDDIKKLENKFIQLKGLADLFSQIKSKGQYRPKDITTKEIYSKSPRAQKFVAEKYRFEIETFGYKCP